MSIKDIYKDLLRKDSYESILCLEEFLCSLTTKEKEQLIN